MKLDSSNENLSVSYLNQAEKTLSKISQLIEEGDYLWASVRIYYCAYYSLYAFLCKIGIKSENQECSIKLAKYLLKKDFIEDIDDFKQNRVDAQYYLKVGQKQKQFDSYFNVKLFFLKFKKLIDNLTDEQIKKICF